MDVLPKTFVQIILAAKWLVRHSSMSPSQQRRPLPSLLSLSLFYVVQSCLQQNSQFVASLKSSKKFPDWHVFTSCTCEQHSCHTAARPLLLALFSTAWPAAGAHRRRTRPGHQLERTGQPRSSPKQAKILNYILKGQSSIPQWLPQKISNSLSPLAVWEQPGSNPSAQNPPPPMTSKRSQIELSQWMN